jgi:hypothetical protein
MGDAAIRLADLPSPDGYAGQHRSNAGTQTRLAAGPREAKATATVPQRASSALEPRASEFVVRLVDRTRREQGLPPVVEDTVTLKHVVVLLETPNKP